MRVVLLQRPLSVIAGVVLVWTHGASLHAQILPPLDEYHIRLFGPDDGLLSAAVRGIAQTPDGYLYVATGRGLMRFDGYRFDRVALPGARSEAIEFMHTDATGRLWITTTGNDLIGHYHEGRFHPLPFHSPPAGLIFSETGDGGAWFSGRSSLLRIDDDTESSPMLYTTSDGLPPGLVFGIHEMSSGERVVLTQTRLARSVSDPGGRGGIRFVPFGPEHECVNNFIASREELLWRCTETSAPVRTFQYRNGRVTEHEPEADLPFLHLSAFEPNGARMAGEWQIDLAPASSTHDAVNFVYRALRSRDGALWMAMSQQREGRAELARYQAGRLDTIPLREYLDFARILDVREDHEGSIWVGTDRGLLQLSPRRVHALTSHQGLAEGFTVPVLQTRDGAVWIGTWGGGLHRFHEGRLTHRLTGADGLPDLNIRALYEARDGTLWVGTGRGFAVLRDERVVLSERGEQVRAFAEAGGAGGNDGTTMWIGTISRLLTWTAGGIVHADMAQWRDRSIWALHMARDGSLWVGSERGLFQMTGDSVRSFGEKDGLRSPFVASIHEEPDGTLWFSTYEHGLHRYRDGRFAVLTTAEGLLHNGVWRMIPDDDGGVWMSSDVGLFRVDHDRLHEVADAIERGAVPHVRLEPIVFTEAEGMPSRESNRASPGGWRLDDGRILFNNIAGAVVIDPKKVLGPRVPPRTVLRSVTIDGESVEFARSVSPVMPAGTKHLSVEFAALSFLTPEQNRYQYRLDGYDDGWVAGGTEHRAQYTNLGPGDYIFRVQGASATGPYGEAAAFSFSLAPFVWQTWWFRLLALGALVTLLMTLHRYRVARLLEMERLRLRIASDLHDDVGSNLSSIALLSEMLKGDARLDELEQRQLQRINRAAEETIGALRDIIWLVAPRHDDLAELVRRMRGVADDMLNGTTYCQFLAENINARPLTMAFMRNALLIYKEAVHNIVKHARAREVVIRVGDEDGLFVLEITDDGPGFDESSIRPGTGLASMRRRAESMGGALTISRTPGGGTGVRFTSRMAQSRDRQRRPFAPR